MHDPSRRVDSLPPRIVSKIAVDDDNGCWVWTACRSTQGYGKVAWAGKTEQAHRVTYTLLVGEIPQGLVIDHLCRNRLCVNPDHMRACTHRENILAPGAQSPAAIHAQLTHCLHAGHPFTPENTYIDYKNTRQCKACRRDREAARRAAIRARRAA